MHVLKGYHESHAFVWLICANYTHTHTLHTKETGNFHLEYNAQWARNTRRFSHGGSPWGALSRLFQWLKIHRGSIPVKSTWWGRKGALAHVLRLVFYLNHLHLPLQLVFASTALNPSMSLSLCFQPWSLEISTQSINYVVWARKVIDRWKRQWQRLPGFPTMTIKHCNSFIEPGAFKSQIHLCRKPWCQRLKWMTEETIQSQPWWALVLTVKIIG